MDATSLVSAWDVLVYNGQEDAGFQGEKLNRQGAEGATRDRWGPGEDRGGHGGHREGEVPPEPVSGMTKSATEGAVFAKGGGGL